MPEPLVSVIMPAYNAEKYLAEAIRSVLDQTYSNWELIIVDDGSSDRTADIAQSFSASDQRINYIFQPNQKVASAKNRGIEKSTGDLIAFIGSDDLWLREKLELQVRTIVETGADIVFSDGFVFPGNDTENEAKTFTSLGGRFQGDEMFELLLIKNRIPDLSILMRREVVRQTGLFNEDPFYYRGCEDYDFWLRAAKSGAVFYGMKERLVRYRVHPNSMTAKKVEIVSAEIDTVKKYLPEWYQHTKAIRKRFRDLYRDLVSALIEANRMTEAKQSMKELWKWDRFGFVTSIQRITIRTLPTKYHAISKRLYAVGSRLSKYRRP